MPGLPEDFSAFKDEILWELRHEDDQGVYETWWSANSRYPLLPVSERLRVAELAVTELLVSGKAVLFRQNALRPDSRREIEDQLAALVDVTTWVPFSEDQVWIGATAISPE